MPPVVSAVGLTKRFGDLTTAVSDFSFEIALRQADVAGTERRNGILHVHGVSAERIGAR